MSNLLPYRSSDHPLPIAGCPCPRTSNLDTLSFRDAHRILVCAVVCGEHRIHFETTSMKLKHLQRHRLRKRPSFRIPHKPPAGSLKVLHAPERQGGIRRTSQTKIYNLETDEFVSNPPFANTLPQFPAGTISICLKLIFKF